MLVVSVSSQKSEYECFFLMIRRPPRSTQSRSSAASDVYKRQLPDTRPCAASLSTGHDCTALWPRTRDSPRRLHRRADLVRPRRHPARRGSHRDPQRPTGRRHDHAPFRDRARVDRERARELAGGRGAPPRCPVPAGPAPSAESRPDRAAQEGENQDNDAPRQRTPPGDMVRESGCPLTHVRVDAEQGKR